MGFRWRPSEWLHLSYESLERVLREQTDPWGFETSRFEQRRFQTMLGLLQRVPHDRVLEAGCAEGHFTQLLLERCREVRAIDLSAAALLRAQQRAPGASFRQIKLEDLAQPATRYDVVICGEMLYYLDDLDAVLDKLPKLAQYLLVSTCYPSALSINRQLSRYYAIAKVFQLGVRERKAASISLWKL